MTGMLGFTNIFCQSAKAEFNEACEKGNAGLYKAAINLFTRCIEIEPNLAEAYFNRAIFKNKISDYNEAIIDFTKAKDLNPKLSAAAYANMAVSKIYLKDYKGSIAHCTKALELDSSLSMVYFNRYISKQQLNLFFCDDLKKAMELGVENAKKILSIGL